MSVPSKWIADNPTAHSHPFVSTMTEEDDGEVFHGEIWQATARMTNLPYSVILNLIQDPRYGKKQDRAFRVVIGAPMSGTAMVVPPSQ